MTGHALPEHPSADDGNDRTQEVVLRRITAEPGISRSLFDLTCGDLVPAIANEGVIEKVAQWYRYEIVHRRYWRRIKELTLAPGQVRTESVERVVGIESTVAEELREQHLITRESNLASVSISGRDEVGLTSEVRVSSTKRDVAGASDTWRNPRDDSTQHVVVWQAVEVVDIYRRPVDGEWVPEAIDHPAVLAEGREEFVARAKTVNNPYRIEIPTATLRSESKFRPL